MSTPVLRVGVGRSHTVVGPAHYRAFRGSTIYYPTWERWGFPHNRSRLERAGMWVRRPGVPAEVAS